MRDSSHLDDFAASATATLTPSYKRINVLNGATVFDKSPNAEFLSEEKKKNKDSRVQNNNLYRIIDNNPDSAWTTDSSEPQYVVFKLSAPSTIFELDFANRSTGHRGADEGNDATKVVEVFVTNDDSNPHWQSVGEFRLAGPKPHYYKGGGTGFDENKSLQRFQIKPTRAKYIKVVFKENYWAPFIFEKYPSLKSLLGYSIGEISALGVRH